MSKVRALYEWGHTADDGRVTYHTAGAVFDVSDAELERGLAAEGLEKVTAADAKKAEKAAAAEKPDPKAAGATDPDAPTTPAGDPAGDGKTDQDAKA